MYAGYGKAPAFGLTPVKGATSYRYTIAPDTLATETITGDQLRIVSDHFEPISFLADRPDAPLTPAQNVGKLRIHHHRTTA